MGPLGGSGSSICGPGPKPDPCSSGPRLDPDPLGLKSLDPSLYKWVESKIQHCHLYLTPI